MAAAGQIAVMAICLLPSLSKSMLKPFTKTDIAIYGAISKILLEGWRWKKRRLDNLSHGVC
jgi:hypothetical protein